MIILDLISNESGYQFRRETAKEYGGPCPFCRAGEDRFNIWPEQGRYWCRRCGKYGDAIDFVREFRQLTFQDAVRYLDRLGVIVRPSSSNLVTAGQPKGARNKSLPNVSPPGKDWRERGWTFVFDCQHRLMEDNENPRPRQWLNEVRGLTDNTLWRYGIGYWPADRYEDQQEWGLADRVKHVWLPRGISIPWVVDGDLWGIRLRRPTGEPKYYWVPGGTASALFAADLLSTAKPAVLVEGEFDAMVISQCASDLVDVVATGSTMGARRIKWLARLALAPLVLIAFDADNAGEEAARYWLDALDNAYRWRPYWGDANDLASDGADIWTWIQHGLSYYLADSPSL